MYDDLDSTQEFHDLHLVHLATYVFIDSVTWFAKKPRIMRRKKSRFFCKPDTTISYVSVSSNLLVTPYGC